jgi:hypothetical protein
MLRDDHEKEDGLVRFETEIWGFNYQIQSCATWETTKEAFKLAESLSQESNIVAGGKTKPM